jgi:hypothetical protein
MNIHAKGLFGARRRGHYAILLLGAAMGSLACAAQPWRNLDIAESRPIRSGSATIQVDFVRGATDLSHDVLLAHIQSAVAAVTAYYGRFPVTRAQILVVPVEGRDGILQGTTWGDRNGFQGFTRVRIGQHTTAQELAEDWMMTHELVHLAFPSMPDDQHWMEEGQATYIEPVARVMTGELKTASIWRDMVHDMPKGVPNAEDQGLDHTHSWASTYWGGALFCLVADVTIRRETGNRKGLRDALRAVIGHGGTIDHGWELPQALAIGDEATGTHVLTRMYAEWKAAPATVDLDKLWLDLGVRAMPDGHVEFIDSAPLAKIRESITAGADLHSAH